MRQADLSWDFALSNHLEVKHQAQLRGWLIDHLHRVIADDNYHAWLMSIAEDTCDAGHVHHDIALWLLGQRELHTVLVTEEHYDLDGANVETTFDTSIASHPYSSITGVQLMSVAKPNGSQMDVGLGVMLMNPTIAGHIEPVSFGDIEPSTMSVNLIPSTITLMGAGERINEFVAFRDDVLQRVRTQGR
ncbi:hypothetical protein [Stomatohabitans albus]|uniref:hypothetical protein n=1 Tax=Stomatohabitans albus TaxID=3110766 RepID=UPI00300CC7D8